MKMRLKTQGINVSSCREEISYELLEHCEPVVAIRYNSIVINIELGGRISLLHVAVYLGPDVRVSTVVGIESVIVVALVNHLVDDVPVLHSECIEMVESVVQVFVDRCCEVSRRQGPRPAGVIVDFVPEQRVA